MMNDDFLAKCRGLDPSASVDREKNRKIIKTRVKEENVIALKNKVIKRPILMAAILIGILSFSATSYNLSPAAWLSSRVIIESEPLEAPPILAASIPMGFVFDSFTFPTTPVEMIILDCN